MLIPSLLDETIADLRCALRAFRAAPLAAVTIVSTVGIGLGLVAVAFSLLNMFLFHVDRVPDVDQMFAVQRPATAGSEGRDFTRAQYDALQRETAVFSGVFAQVPDVDGRLDGRTVTGTYVTGNAFPVLGVQAAMGRVLSPGDDDTGAGRASCCSAIAAGIGSSGGIRRSWAVPSSSTA